MMERHPSRTFRLARKSTPGVPKPQSAMSVETTSYPCAARTVDIAPAPQQGSQIGPRNWKRWSSASVTQFGVA